MIFSSKVLINMLLPLAFLGPLPSYAGGMPQVDLKEVCSNAEVIIVGRVIKTEETPQIIHLTRLLLEGGRDIVTDSDDKQISRAKFKEEYELGIRRATIIIEKVLKGHLSNTTMYLEFPEYRKGLGKRSAVSFATKLERLPINTRIILCARASSRENSGFVFANAYRSVLRIAEIPEVSHMLSERIDTQPPDQTIAALLQASLSEFSRISALESSMRDLINLKGRAAGPAFQSLLAQSSDAVVRGKALAAMIQIGDYSRMSDAVTYLLSETETNSAVYNTKLVLSSRMSLVTNVGIISQFYGPLLQHTSAFVRSDATCALGHAKPYNAIPHFIKGLEDADRDVRYHSLFALAETLNQFELGWAQSAELFEKNEQEYITRWKTWWQMKGEAEFTSTHSSNRVQRK